MSDIIDRCMICGFVVDLSHEATTPMVELSPGATNRNRRTATSSDDAQRLVSEFEDAVRDMERNDFSVIRRDELAATRTILIDALTARQPEGGGA